jgi:DNA helicase II / ATP-dependent DNA helicase PcrA
MSIDYSKHFLHAYDLAFVKNGKSRPRPNPEQTAGITSPANSPTYLVAGPGTGKTTVLTLRILKLITCDQIPPGAILATTFTVKAAAELRSRILGWGYPLIKALLADTSLSAVDRQWLESVDLNQVVTGTLDSLCQDALSQHRAPGMQPPVMIDSFLSNTVLVRQGLFPGRLHTRETPEGENFDAWLLTLRNDAKFGWNLGAKRGLLMSLWDRLHQDQVDHSLLEQAGVPSGVAESVQTVLGNYGQYLVDNGWLDFSMLEHETLARLRAGELDDWAKSFRVALVDEYQDSNLLQEQIYFTLCQRSGAAMTVVGDDDQSLYRFRGATVEIFTQFPNRFADVFGQPEPQPIFLNTNYRSTTQVIDFVNDFIGRDASYQKVRVAAKPQIAGPAMKPGLPILGIFRDTTDELADSVGEFLAQVCGKGFRLPDGTVLKLGVNGHIGDCCLLASSPQEFKPTPLPNPRNPDPEPEIRFPGLLRETLGCHDLPIFNPRGRPLSELLLVQQLGGLLLEGLDPRGMVQATDSVQKRIGNDAKRLFPIWRDEGRLLARSNPTLKSLIDGWAARDPGRAGYQWPRSVSVLELLYGIVHYLPELHDNPEGQVYLEVFTRQLTAMSLLSGFEGRVTHDPSNPELNAASVRNLICDWLAPLADGTVEVDEEMLGSFPTGHLPVLSIHQSKGLEFPLVLVDVGSDFKATKNRPRGHEANAFKRFPRGGGASHNLEDLLRPLSGLKGIAKTSLKDRAFDDLERLYFVAFSRAQEVLVLVGLNDTRPNIGVIPNVATGWDRKEQPHGKGWPITYLD